MRFHIISRLTLAEVDQAFALIQLEAPELSLAAWRQFARAAGGGKPPSSKPTPAGLVAVKDARNYMAGLCAYRRTRSFRHGPTLTVDCFVALDFLHTQGAAAHLLRHLDETAAVLGCTAIEITLARQETRLIDQFRAAGHALEGVLLCKMLPAC